MIPKCKKTAALFSAVIIAVSVSHFAAAKSYSRGDADMNGRVDVNDARTVLRYAVGMETLTATAVAICDANDDGTVDVLDARVILRHAVGLETISAKAVELSEDTTAAKNETTAKGESTTKSESTTKGDSETKGDSATKNESATSKGESSDGDDLLGDLSEYPLPAIPQYEKKSGYFTFIVYGSGHGVGMSQRGAIYMAQKGCTYQYILSHYFSGSVICQDETIPEKTSYCGEEYDTLNLLCRMVTQEIGGAEPPLEALKAQTVAIFTLMKKYDFKIGGKWDVATICDTSARIWTNEWTQKTLIPTVLAVAGLYLAKSGDKSKEPILSVYSSMAAGASVNCSDIWYENYPVSVKSPFEMSMDGFVSVVQFSAEEIKAKILKAIPDTILSDDPSKWIKIMSHTASIDENRGYVTQVLVGDTLLSKSEKLSDTLGLGLDSGCFTVEYTK